MTNPDLKFSPEIEHKNIILPTELQDIERSYDDVEELDRNDYSQNQIVTKELEESIIRDRIFQERIWNMLVTTVNKTNYTPPEDRNTVILDLACNSCEEMETASLFFGGEKFSLANASKNVELVGVDNDSEGIELAKKKVRKEFEDNFKFVTADIATLDRNPNVDIPAKADVVILRHQQMFQGDYNDNNIVKTVVWVKILNEAIGRLQREGILIITSYTEDEHNQLVKFLTEVKYPIVVNEENEFSEPLGAGGIDKYVVIVQNKPTI